MTAMKLAPSLLASDLSDLRGALAACHEGGADVVHFDVMDGHFVPNLSFGVPLLEAAARHTDLPIDVHLMVEEPGRLLDLYLQAGASWVSVHWEATRHLDRLLAQIRDAGCRAGVVLNPATPVEMLHDVLGSVDYVVLMSVNPGFGGQKFIPYVLEKARRLRQLLDSRGLTVDIEMDGGVAQDNIRQVVEAGVNVCVTGSAAFKADQPAAAMRDLRRLALGSSP